MKLSVAYSRPLWVNTVLCLFNTIQPSSLMAGDSPALKIMI